MSNKENYKGSNGKCPVCGSTLLEYGASEFQDEHVYFPFTCANCENQGKEWYKLTDGETIVPRDQVDLTESEVQELKEKTEEQE